MSKPVSMFEVLENKKVKICGIKQNCFALDTLPITKRHVEPVKVYPSLERKKLPNGFIEEVELKDYPISKETVNSYVDGADYRRDPATAIANAPKRVNLGDITEVQRFIAEDPQHALRSLRNVTSQLEEYIKTQKKEPQQEPQQEPNGGNQ